MKTEFFNRELSWLEFNHRVLEEAKSSKNPLLERLKFVAITASNLDEFFMVRVGGLHMSCKARRRKKDPAGMTPRAQLREVRIRTRAMMEDLSSCYNKLLKAQLARAGVRQLNFNELDAEQEMTLFDWFREELYPVITPMAVVENKTVPLIQNLELHLLVKLKELRGKNKGESRYVLMPLGRAGKRFIRLSSTKDYNYVLLEDLVKHQANQWFPGYEVVECVSFRVTRNANFAVEEDEAPDLLAGMSDILEERKTGDCIRLEVESSISKDLLRFLCDTVGASKESVYAMSGVLHLKDFMDMAFIPDFDELKLEQWPAQSVADIVPNEAMFEQLTRQDFLMYHPYETFDPVVRFISEAAEDDQTLAIKMVLYRTSKDSPMIQSLLRAAENGINVTVLMELKARFDEAQNMDWARKLEQGGVQVVYGVKNYKTHAKVCVVVRREASGVVRYCHFGTGNYNESTARLYGDISYMTRNKELGSDASSFFNALCGYAQPQDLQKLSMAPISLRQRILELIDLEIEQARRGSPARIIVKVNSLVDVKLIEKMYEASNAGVKIDLNIRGICTLVPGKKGMSENIRVTSIIDRYLEHARIVYFYHGGKAQTFISSADWMPRNLDKRLELLVPVEDKESQKRLIHILETHMADTENSWVLQGDGSYKRSRTKSKKLRSQAYFYDEACEAIAQARRMRRTRFEAHRKKGED